MFLDDVGCDECADGMISPDNTYEVRFNGAVQKAGSVLEDFDPAVNPPKMIDDPQDKKPKDWVDKKKIPDVTAVKVGPLCTA